MEVWKDIPEYSGLYEASNKGRIRSKEGKTTSSARYEARVWKQRIIKQKYTIKNKGKRKDAMVCLWKDRKPHYHLVSRLIASTFIKNNLYSNMTVNHIDGNSENNNADNLEWISREANVKYGFENGQYKNICHTVRIETETGIKEFQSKAKADIWLGRYRGYVSRNLSKGQNQVKNKKGETFNVI